jgi:pimeloyl-ACP methyl ester carboxylesterase
MSFQEQSVRVLAGRVALQGDLVIPRGARGLVVFAHGSGSSRHSPRNRYVARVLNQAGLATLLFDLLTPDQERVDQVTAELRFDIPMLARRLADATDWLIREPSTGGLRIGYFGASTGAAAALIAAAEHPERISAVVSRGGRPDLAGVALGRVRAPTLLIVGGDDDVVITLNEDALHSLRCAKRLQIVPGATHLFEEPGTLESAAQLARDWFVRYLVPSAAPVGAGHQNVKRNTP